MAVIIRPDMAFTVSRLARFLINPGPLHHKAANKVISYLAGTKDLILYFGGFNDLEVVNNALFANNNLDRKSSQVFVIKLFRGLISWRANKQDTVTISTTKAELLTLSQAAKKSLYISRLVTELG